MSSTRERFNELVDEWKVDTLFESSVDAIINHEAYQEIITLGEQAIPWIIEELEVEIDHWFYALAKITGENPVPEEEWGNMRKNQKTWVEWWKNRPNQS
ncbi:MAG: hypothetical protein ABI425_00265 [Patescibacteria group bacterium]